LPSSSKISIVILNWNGRKFLEQFLPSVFLSTYPDFDVIVADNASTDDSLAFLKQHYPRVRIIRLHKNFGYAKGYNEALKQVESDYYLLLNSDVEVSPGWLEPMVTLLENDASIAACQPKLLSFRNKKLFEYAGAAGGWLDKYGYPFSRGRVFDRCEEDHGQYDSIEPVFWASGAAFFVRSAVFHQLNGFDEYFFAHQEEIDLCWRIQLAGYKIYACPSSVVYHVGGGTLSKDSFQKTYLNFRNNRIMLSKNLPFPRNLWVLIARSFLDAVSAWKGLLTGNGRYFFAIVRANMGFVRWWLFKRDKSIFPISRKGNLIGLLQKNIVWLYFIKKKRTFFQIITHEKSKI
jgi:GT2 family glycosyltransferase